MGGETPFRAAFKDKSVVLQLECYIFSVWQFSDSYENIILTTAEEITRGDGCND